jgi:hypothetical protein
LPDSSVEVTFTFVPASNLGLNGGKGNGTDSKTNNNQDKKQFLKTYPKTGEVDP